MIEVVDNVEDSQYEVLVEGKLVGFAAYHQTPDGVLLTHAEVEPDLQARGFGTALAKGALDDIRRQGLQAVPLCPFIVDFVARHPEYNDLITSLRR